MQVSETFHCCEDRPNLDTWWLSFTIDGNNLGVMIVDGGDEDAACLNAAGVTFREKITCLLNPGIEVVAMRLIDCEHSHKEIAQFGKDRLIPTKELDDAGYNTIPIEVIDGEMRIASRGSA